MKNFIVLLALSSFSTFAQTPPPGPTPSVGSILLETANSGVPYRRTNTDTSRRCPDILTLAIKNYNATERSDVTEIYLQGQRRREGYLTTAPLDQGVFLLAPNLRLGRKTKLAGECGFGLGVICNSKHVTETANSIISESSGRAASLILAGSHSTDITFNRNRDITYRSRGNGVPELVCTYTPDESIRVELAAQEERFREGVRRTEAYTAWRSQRLANGESITRADYEAYQATLREAPVDQSDRQNIPEKQSPVAPEDQSTVGRPQ